MVFMIELVDCFGLKVIDVNGGVSSTQGRGFWGESAMKR